MSISCRRYLVDKQDGTVRMKSSMFERLVRDPLHHSMPDLAGQQRALVAEIIVELRDRVPVQRVRCAYFVLPFDGQGRVDTERLRTQQRALAASVIDPVIASRKDPADLHDAADRFIAQGGRWRPAAELASLIDRAALGIAAQRWRLLQPAASALAWIVHAHYNVCAFAQVLEIES